MKKTDQAVHPQRAKRVEGSAAPALARSTRPSASLRPNGVRSRWVALSARRPWLILLCCLGLGLASFLVARGLDFRGDFAELLPEASGEVRDMHYVEQRAGSVGYLIVQVKGGDAAARSAFAERVAKRLEAQPELVRYVEHRFDAQFFRDRALWLMPLQKLTALERDVAARVDFEKKRANPLVVDLLDDAPPPTLEEIGKRHAPADATRDSMQSKDGSERYLFVKPRGSVTDLTFNRKLIAATQAAADAELVGAPGLSIGLTGSYVVRVEEDDAMKRDLNRASGLAVIIALGIIVLATRRLTALAVVFVPVAVGIAFTFAVARLGVGHLNPITGFLAAVLVGLGIEYGVHLVMRFAEERRSHATLPALQAAVAGTANGALTSALTNAAAFAALGFAQFAAFRQFGLLAAVGVMATVVTTYLLGPALLVLTEKLGKARPLAAPQGTASGGTPTWLRPASWALLLAVGGFAVWSVTVRGQVGFETDMRKLRGASRSTDLNVHVNEQLGLVMNPALLHVPTLDGARALAEIARAHSKERGDDTAIDKVVSMADLLPRDVDAHREQIAALRKTLERLDATDDRAAPVRRMLDAEPWSEAELPPEVRRRFTALEGGGHLVLIFPRTQSFDTREADAWAADLTAVAQRARAAGIDARVLDGNLIASRILTLVRKDGPGILLRAALAVFLMIWVSLRSLRSALLVAAPLYLGLVCLVGVMQLFGLKLNFFNIVLLPSLLSIAVDNSVHVFHRYREEGKGSLGRVVRTTGLAALAATLSNAAGYATLLVAGHTGFQSIGTLAIAGVACTFVGTTVLFPALLLLLEPLHRRGARSRHAVAAGPGAGGHAVGVVGRALVGKVRHVLLGHCARRLDDVGVADVRVAAQLVRRDPE